MVDESQSWMNWTFMGMVFKDLNVVKFTALE